MQSKRDNIGINAKDILRTEMIGKDIEIIDSKNKSLLGLKGRIIDETKNSFIIMHNGKRKMILKSHVKMIIIWKDKKVLVDGKMLARRPEDRINIKGV